MTAYHVFVQRKKLDPVCANPGHIDQLDRSVYDVIAILT
jgi:hypothetical protein